MRGGIPGFGARGWRKQLVACALLAPSAMVAPALADEIARFDINAFEVKGNTLLPASEVETLIYSYMGPGRTAEDVEAARAALQSAYEKRGYATVSVFIPEQGVERGVIRLEVQAQTIGKVAVLGTSPAGEARVRAQAPSLQPGIPPNFQDVQRDIIALNQAADRRVSPEVTAGEAPGTVDVALKVEEDLALHGSAEVNNYSSASTTDLRVAASLRYDDLFHRGDSISISAQTAPKRTDDGTVFSTNLLTHIGGLQLLGYYVHSDSNIAAVGGTSVIGKGDLGGVRLILPLGQSEGFYQSLTAGVDYKNFKEDVTLGADRSSAPIEYFPFTVGWRGDWAGERAKSNLSLSTTFGIHGFGDNDARFDFKRFQAPSNFFYVRGEGATTRELGAGFQFYAHLSGQYSDTPLISNEEFSVGGIDTVRGFFESESLGDYGFANQYEGRSPSLFSSLKFLNELRLITFFDSGYSGIHAPLGGQVNHDWLASAGGGLRIKAFKLFNGTLDLGVPLVNGSDTKSGDFFTRFRIWGEF